jgi:hypothetical protein
MFTTISSTMARNSYVNYCIWHNGQVKLQLYKAQWPGIAMFTIDLAQWPRIAMFTIVSCTMARNSYVYTCIWHNGQE